MNYYFLFTFTKVDCGNGIRSFGKRRRRRDADAKLGALGERLVYDPNLGQEVIALDTPLRKQIFVDPGITVNRFTADPLGSGDDSRSGQGRSLSGATGGQGGNQMEMLSTSEALKFRSLIYNKKTPLILKN